MKLPALDPRTWTLVAAGLAVAILWGYYGMILSPLAGAAMRTGRELSEAEQQLQDIERGLAQEPQLQQQQRELQARVAQLHARVPREDQLSNVVQHLTEIATQTGTKVQSVSPQASSAPPSPLTRDIPIELDAQAGYHQLGVFLSRLETEGPPLQLKSLRISGNPKLLRRHHIAMKLHASLVLLSPQDGPASGTAKRKGAKKDKKDKKDKKGKKK